MFFFRRSMQLYSVFERKPAPDLIPRVNAVHPVGGDRFA
jgi:hypothetical protein